MEGLLLGLLVFRAARWFAARGHPTTGAVLFGALAVLSLAVPYSAQQAVLVLGPSRSLWSAVTTLMVGAGSRSLAASWASPQSSVGLR